MPSGNRTWIDTIMVYECRITPWLSICSEYLSYDDGLDGYVHESDHYSSS